MPRTAQWDSWRRISPAAVDGTGQWRSSRIRPSTDIRLSLLTDRQHCGPALVYAWHVLYGGEKPRRSSMSWMSLNRMLPCTSGWVGELRAWRLAILHSQDGLTNNTVQINEVYIGGYM